MTGFRGGRSVEIFIFEKTFMMLSLVLSISLLFWNDYVRNKVYLDEQKDFE